MAELTAGLLERVRRRIEEDDALGIRGLVRVDADVAHAMVTEIARLRAALATETAARVEAERARDEYHRAGRASDDNAVKFAAALNAAESQVSTLTAERNRLQGERDGYETERVFALTAELASARREVERLRADLHRIADLFPDATATAEAALASPDPAAPGEESNHG